MARTVTERLQSGILAAKGGGHERARELLASVVAQEPANEKGWYWLGVALSSQAEKTWCFRRALELNPGNQEARRELDSLAFKALRESGLPPNEISGVDLSKIIAEKPKIVIQAEAEQAAVRRTPSGSIPAFTKPFYDESESPPETTTSPAAQKPVTGPFSAPVEPVEKPVKAPQPRRSASGPLAASPSPEKMAPSPGKTGPLQNRLDDGGIQDLRNSASFSDMNTVTEIKSPRRGKRRLLFAAAGVLVVIAIVVAVMVLGQGKAPAAVVEPTPYPSAAPTAVAAVATSAPSPTPAPTATQALQHRVEAIQGAILIAQDHYKAGRFDDAGEAWTDLIDKVPDYANLYLWRAESTLSSAQQDAESLEAFQQALDAVFKDLDQAELLEPGLAGVDGMRAKVEMAYARSTFEETARSTWLSQAGSHAQAAISALQADEEVTLIPYYVQMAQGECKEALDALGQANPLGASADTISTGWHTVLAAANMCAGQNGKAMEEINLALVQPNMERRMLKAMIYYNLGMYPEAIGLIDEWIAAVPKVRSDRIFLRALANLDSGKRMQAIEDLKAGQAESWDMDGIGLFVEGRLAALGGNGAKAAQLYRESANRMRQDYAPLLRRVRNYLSALTG